VPLSLCLGRLESWLESNEPKPYAVLVSTAEKIFHKAKTLPEPAQDVLLRLAEVLAHKASFQVPLPKPQFGSAKGMITMGPEFDEPLEDFKPYME